MPDAIWVPSNCLLEGSFSDAFCISGLQTLAWLQCSQDSPRCDTQGFPHGSSWLCGIICAKMFNLSKKSLMIGQVFCDWEVNCGTNRVVNLTSLELRVSGIRNCHPVRFFTALNCEYQSFENSRNRGVLLCHK